MPRFIKQIDGALDPALCSELIAHFERSSSEHHIGVTGAGVDPQKKRSVDITLDDHRTWDEDRGRILAAISPHVLGYMRKFRFLLIGALSPSVRHPRTGEPVTLTNDNFDEVAAPYVGVIMNRIYRPGGINLQKYLRAVGGYPHWHSEIYSHPRNTEALHRVLFWICYLNDVEEGGETEFAYQEVKVKPKAGRLLIAPAGFTHTHRGNTPLSNDKYVLASWVLYHAGGPLEGRSRQG